MYNTKAMNCKNGTLWVFYSINCWMPKIMSSPGEDKSKKSETMHLYMYISLRLQSSECPPHQIIVLYLHMGLFNRTIFSLNTRTSSHWFWSSCQARSRTSGYLFSSILTITPWGRQVGVIKVVLALRDPEAWSLCGNKQGFWSQRAWARIEPC